jgi:multidrug resistance efflux pump
LVAAKADEAAAQALVREAQQARSEHLAPLRAQVRQLRSRLAAQQSAATAVAGAAEEFPAASEVEVVEPDQWVRAEQLEALEAALAGATAQLAESTSQWTPAIQDAEQQLAVALGAVKQLRGRLAMAERRSPMDGVVTSISVQAGQWVGAYQPVVRVDNPDGYRVVALVDKATRERMARGQTVPLSISGTPDRGKLEKVVAGWDKDLYSYWLWFKPSHPEKLRPGQAVRVDLEPAAPA